LWLYWCIVRQTLEWRSCARAYPGWFRDTAALSVFLLGSVLLSFGCLATGRRLTVCVVWTRRVLFGFLFVYFCTCPAVFGLSALGQVSAFLIGFATYTFAINVAKSFPGRTRSVPVASALSLSVVWFSVMAVATQCRTFAIVAYSSYLLGFGLVVLVLTIAQSRARRLEVPRMALATLRESFWIAVALFHGCWLGGLLLFVVTVALAWWVPKNVALGLSSVTVGVLAGITFLLMVTVSIRERDRPPHLICCVLGVVSIEALGLFFFGLHTCWMFVFR